VGKVCCARDTDPGLVENIMDPPLAWSPGGAIAYAIADSRGHIRNTDGIVVITASMGPRSSNPSSSTAGRSSRIDP
jgi:hypothetical protein